MAAAVSWVLGCAAAGLSRVLALWVVLQAQRACGAVMPRTDMGVFSLGLEVFASSNVGEGRVLAARVFVVVEAELPPVGGHHGRSLLTSSRLAGAFAASASTSASASALLVVPLIGGVSVPLA